MIHFTLRISVTALNRCGSGPEFKISVELSTITISSTSSISPTVTDITDLMSIMTIGNAASTTTSSSIATTDNGNIS